MAVSGWTFLPLEQVQSTAAQGALVQGVEEQATGRQSAGAEGGQQPSHSQPSGSQGPLERAMLILISWSWLAMLPQGSTTVKVRVTTMSPGQSPVEGSVVLESAKPRLRFSGAQHTSVTSGLPVVSTSMSESQGTSTSSGKLTKPGAVLSSMARMASRETEFPQASVAMKLTRVLVQGAGATVKSLVMVTWLQRSLAEPRPFWASQACTSLVLSKPSHSKVTSWGSTSQTGAWRSKMVKTAVSLLVLPHSSETKKV
mmetsp:Transcript_99171/g.137747  ORF Transcript_99171/g.137747 Transcript_99171/m.137747 type:complete len:256 (+) Transcript_99171:326-1093(+)